MIPGIGTLYQALTIATGNDPVAGRCLSRGERVLSGVLLGATVFAHSGLRRTVAGRSRQLSFDFPDLPKPLPRMQWHHPYPKYLGGAEDQALVEIPQKYHALIHDELDKVFPRMFGGKFWEKVRKKDPEAFSKRVWQALSSVYQKYPLTDDPDSGIPFRWTQQQLQ